MNKYIYSFLKDFICVVLGFGMSLMQIAYIEAYIEYES